MKRKSTATLRKDRKAKVARLSDEKLLSHPSQETCNTSQSYANQGQHYQQQSKKTTSKAEYFRKKYATCEQYRNKQKHAQK